ncbi:hypothetical protein B0J11DRAFT_542065 [Dendryphion nanum]|uniref:Uncharacterized protein n=1 Tax=Dendryphion nanum TaxID=256645 RepID=A0A9P9D5M7_9PLEO|nr:hypothetical protein B0J11DRAFT_542065 [Dendryphion nanum]
MVWSLGVSYFGIMFATILRRHLVERDSKSLWPGASATAHLINALHHPIVKTPTHTHTPAATGIMFVGKHICEALSREVLCLLPCASP